jgi:hypothetical protein
VRPVREVTTACKAGGEQHYKDAALQQQAAAAGGRLFGGRRVTESRQRAPARHGGRAADDDLDVGVLGDFELHGSVFRIGLMLSNVARISANSSVMFAGGGLAGADPRKDAHIRQELGTHKRQETKAAVALA